MCLISTKDQFGKHGKKFSKLVTPGHDSFVGVPKNLKILKIWSISDSPVKNGSPRTHWANKQPIPHISTSNDYASFLNNNSAGFYHNLLASLPLLSLSLGSSGVYGTCGTNISLDNA